jgi:hypothetical protein
MHGHDEVLKAVLSLREATEMGFNSIEARCASIEASFDARLSAQDTRFDRLERQMRDGFAVHDERFDRIEREVRDGFVAVNSRLDRHRGARGGDRP